jgi:RNA polymerase sigma factor (sigma-70 family)
MWAMAAGEDSPHLARMEDSERGAFDPVTRPDVAATLVANHRDFLAFLERRVGDRRVAEDILQDAFVRGLGKLETLREDEAVVAWFYRMLRNAVIDHYRRKSALTRGLAAFAQEVETQESPSVETHDAICRCVAELAGTLKAEYATALRRVEVDGVAESTRCTRACFRIRRGRSSRACARVAIGSRWPVMARTTPPRSQAPTWGSRWAPAPTSRCRAPASHS